MSSNKKKKSPEEKEPELSQDTAPDTESAAPPEEEPEKKPEAETKPETPSADALFRAEHDRYLRLAAEYDNFRKRSAKERESIYSDVRADTVAKLLPVYDNLARALEQPTQDEAYRRGVEMTMTQFSDILARLGVTEIEAVGKTFDPAFHNAVMHEVDETKGEGEIVQELQKGFKLGDKVIRFAMVKVAN